MDLEQWDGAVDLMAEAARLAPQWARVQPLGQVVLAQLLEHWPSRRPGKLHAVAAHFAPDERLSS